VIAPISQTTQKRRKHTETAQIVTELSAMSDNVALPPVISGGIDRNGQKIDKNGAKTAF
jgi:hypothetical protein